MSYIVDTIKTFKTKEVLNLFYVKFLIERTKSRIEDKDGDLLDLGTGILQKLIKSKETPLGIFGTFATRISHFS